MSTPKRSPNAALWSDAGITPDAHAQADEGMALAMEAVQLLGASLAAVVFKEAIWQCEELPKRTAKFRALAAWKPVHAWFWRGGGVQRCGPFATMLEAAAAAKRADNGEPIEGFTMWCEALP